MGVGGHVEKNFGLLRGLLRNARVDGIEIQNMTTVEYRSTAKMVVAMTQ